MRILAIETSCDETAIALVEARGSFKKNDVYFNVAANIILSQVKLHKKYGGVFPNLAKREHERNLLPVLGKVLEEDSEESRIKNHELSAIKKEKVEKLLERYPTLQERFWEFSEKTPKPDIDAVSITYGPGLEPALWVGVNFAKALSLIWNVSLIPVNHMVGHMLSAALEKKSRTEYKITNIAFPALALLISGGHTELVLMRNWTDHEVVGQTRDDAVGEAFDKVARMLGLPYPGGPEISKISERARKEKTVPPKLPRPMINSNDFDFSFSGLKTSVLYRIKKKPVKTAAEKAIIAREFQEAATEVLVKKTARAAKHYNAQTILVGGGVSANNRIRDALRETTEIGSSQTRLLIAPIETTGDNALMIAAAGYLSATLRPEMLVTPAGVEAGLLKAEGNLRI